MSPEDDSPPLITSRSPSYERAREERLHPSPTGDPHVVAFLARLVEAEENARAAYQAAATQARDAALAERLGDAAGAHAERARVLGERIQELGGAPPRPDEARAILAHDAESVARAGDDAALVAALRATRADLQAVHAEAAGVPGWDPARTAGLPALPAA